MKAVQENSIIQIYFQQMQKIKGEKKPLTIMDNQNDKKILSHPLHILQENKHWHLYSQQPLLLEGFLSMPYSS